MANPNSRLMESAEANARFHRAAFEQQRQGMFGAGLGALAGLGQAAGHQPWLRSDSSPSQNYYASSAAMVDRSLPAIKYKPTIEAGDSIRDVLQNETDEWLKEIK